MTTTATTSSYFRSRFFFISFFLPHWFDNTTEIPTSTTNIILVRSYKTIYLVFILDLQYSIWSCKNHYKFYSRTHKHYLVFSFHGLRLLSSNKKKKTINIVRFSSRKIESTPELVKLIFSWVSLFNFDVAAHCASMKYIMIFRARLKNEYVRHKQHTKSTLETIIFMNEQQRNSH